MLTASPDTPGVVHRCGSDSGLHARCQTTPPRRSSIVCCRPSKPGQAARWHLPPCKTPPDKQPVLMGGSGDACCANKTKCGNRILRDQQAWIQPQPRDGRLQNLMGWPLRHGTRIVGVLAQPTAQPATTKPATLHASGPGHRGRFIGHRRVDPSTAAVDGRPVATRQEPCGANQQQYRDMFEMAGWAWRASATRQAAGRESAL